MGKCTGTFGLHMCIFLVHINFEKIIQKCCRMYCTIVKQFIVCTTCKYVICYFIKIYYKTFKFWLVNFLLMTQSNSTKIWPLYDKNAEILQPGQNILLRVNRKTIRNSYLWDELDEPVDLFLVYQRSYQNGLRT